MSDFDDFFAQCDDVMTDWQGSHDAAHWTDREGPMTEREHLEIAYADYRQRHLLGLSE